MALFTSGGTVGQISGRVGGIVYSRNKGGSYIRNGTIPTTSTTAAAIAAKTRLGNASTAWMSLTDAQRASWKAWAAENPILNRLGQSIILPANAAYISLATRMALIGETAASAPPIIPPPDGLLTCTATWDIGAGNFELTYTATPLGANEKLFLYAAVSNSDSINFVENTKRYVGVSAAAQASPFDAQTLIEAVFGSLQVGQKVTIDAHVIDTANGQLSRALRNTGIVVST